MSGDPPIVELAGNAMARLVSAIPVVIERTGRAVVLVGGLAVMCRLPAPYRVTTDIDTVDRRSVTEPSQLELLVSSGATPSGPSGVLVRTLSGDVQVDILDVTDEEVGDLPEDPTDRLHVLAHAWAATTATSLTLTVEGLQPQIVRVAEPGPIIAMKLQSIMNRSAAKEGTDLLDILRITLDRGCGPASRDQLEAADPQLRADALLHTRRWFDGSATRSLSRIRAVPEGRDVEIDDVRIGITGHSNLAPESVAPIAAALRAVLAEQRGPLVGVSCLARGADQIFARVVLDLAGELEVVLPAADYSVRKVQPENRADFDALVAGAGTVRTLPFENSNRAAYEAANEVVLGGVDHMIAVWDGVPPDGRGGTADTVRIARERGLPVTVVWPGDARRE